MSIRHHFQALKKWHREANSESADAFLPPTSTDKMQKALKNFPFELPADARLLYEQGDGMKDNAPLFREYTFYPLREAVDEYELMCEVTETLGEHSQWKTSWLPIFGFQGDLFVIECDLLSAERGRIYYHAAEDQPYPWYDSLEQMLLTIRKCFEQKAYFFDEDEILTEDFEAANAIREQLNPRSARIEVQKPEPLEETIDEQPDGTKRITTRYSEDHYIEQFFGPDNRKTGQCEYSQGNLIRRDTWEYPAPGEVEITSENMMGIMMTTKNKGTIAVDGTVEIQSVSSYMNGELMFEQNMNDEGGFDLAGFDDFEEDDSEE